MRPRLSACGLVWPDFFFTPLPPHITTASPLPSPVCCNPKAANLADSKRRQVLKLHSLCLAEVTHSPRDVSWFPVFDQVAYEILSGAKSMVRHTNHCLSTVITRGPVTVLAYCDKVTVTKGLVTSTMMAADCLI